jgi:hypothetical protein
MVVPVNAEKNETQEIAQELGSESCQGRQAWLMRNLKFQDHDGNDNRKHAIAKGFESALGH